MRHIKFKKVLIILILALIILLLRKTIVVFAATSSELRTQRDQNQQQINETKEEQEKIKSQMSSIQQEVETLNNQIANYQGEIDDLASQIEDATNKIEELQKELETKEKELAEKELLLEKRLVASYKAGETSYLDVLLSSDSLTSFLSNYYLIEQIAESDTKLINEIKATKQRIEDSKVELEDTKKSLETSKTLQETKRDNLAAVKASKSAKVSQLSDDEQVLQSRIDEMQAQDATIRAAIKKAEAAEAAAAAARARSSSSSGSSSSSSSSSSARTSNPGGFIYPVPSYCATVTTGMYYKSGGYHGAVDFGAAGVNGQPVYAVKAGTVVLTQSLTYSYGNYVMIDHHDGTYTLYAHGQAGSICVSPGQNVSQGQQIMRVGSTGNSSGPHLHFEVRVSPGGYNNRVNPMAYLP